MAIFQSNSIPKEHVQVVTSLANKSEQIFSRGSSLFKNTYQGISENLRQNYSKLYSEFQTVNDSLDYGRYHESAKGVIDLFKMWRKIADPIYNADKGLFGTSFTSNYWSLVKKVDDEIIKYYNTNKKLPPFEDLIEIYRFCSEVAEIEVNKISKNPTSPTLYLKFYHIGNCQHILGRILSSYNSYK